MNQMVSSIMCNALSYNLIMPLLTLIFNVISPINSPVICRMYFIVNNVISYHIIILLDSLVVIKYIFIFHLKNPTAVQDDFWKVWINLWTFVYFLLSEIVINTLPGRDNPRISICIEKIPLKHINAPYKIVLHILIVTFLTIIINIGFFSLRLKYKNFDLKKLQEYKNYKIKFSGTNKDTLFNFVTTLVTFVMFFSALIFSVIISSLHPSDLDTYPYYLMEYTIENLMPSGAILLFLTIYLYKNNQVRRTVLIEFERLISCQE
jgi:hypothetical protein